MAERRPGEESVQRFHPRRIRLIGPACVVLLLGSLVIIAAAAADNAAAAARQVPAVSKARAMGALRILAAQDLKGPDWPVMSPVLSAPVDYPTVDVLACMAEQHSDVAATVEDFTAARPARLNPELSLFSTAPRHLDVTLVTAFSNSRLYMLEGMCASWKGPLSAAVYQGYHAGTKHAFFQVQKAKAAVQELFERMEMIGSCQLDIVLYSEAVASELAADVLYPLNALRNAGMLMARTELLFILDGDMLVSQDLSVYLADPVRFEEVKRLCNEKSFVVVPAFDTRNVKLAYAAAEAGKQRAMGAFKSGKLISFLKGDYDPAHGPTNVERWYTASKHYDVQYVDGYEPWGLMSRRLTPFFDVRFRGYGKDKIQYLRLLDSIGFKFTVMADSFVVHRPHAKTKAKEIFLTDQTASLKLKTASIAIADAILQTMDGARDSSTRRSLHESQDGREVGRRDLQRVIRGRSAGQIDSQTDTRSAMQQTLNGAERSELDRSSESRTPVQLYNVTNTFYKNFIGELSQGRYHTLVTEGFEHCRQKLPWWRGFEGADAVPVQTSVTHADG